MKQLRSSESLSLPPAAAHHEDEAPEGYRFVWVADTDWELLSEHDNRRCRMKGCATRAVAMLRRQNRRSQSGFAWWPYCGLHLYGRKIEYGAVKCRRLVPKGEEQSPS